MMRTQIEHVVWFGLEEGEGAVVPIRGMNAYGRIMGVTVRLNGNREPMVTAQGRRCRKDGERDRRIGNVLMPVVVNEAEWVERARSEVGKGALADGDD